MKVLFAGTPEVAVPSLELLAGDREHFEVVSVLTRPDAPSGRGRRLMPSPVKEAALRLGLTVLESDPSDPSFPDVVRATGARYAAVVAYGRILRQPVLDALEGGWYNLHFSLLPQWRGAAPVQRSIWSGDTVTGATVFRLTKGMDEGPILSQSTVEIGSDENAGQLLDRLAQDGSRLLAASLEAVGEGRARLVPQSPGAYEVAGKVTGEDAHIRFDVPAFAADRQIRACTPEPGAWCLLHAEGGRDDAGPSSRGDSGLVLHVLRARPLPTGDRAAPRDLPAGRLARSKRQVWVGTKSDPLELLEVKPAGKKAMKAADWARGARLADDAWCG